MNTPDKNNTHWFSSKTNEWPTPRLFFKKLNREFAFDLDPCADAENAKCERFFTKETDGLKKSWRGSVVFMNPPYSRGIGDWMAKALHESRHATVVCLVPARTDTAWWHDYAVNADEIRYLRGRLKFGDGKHSAPFPSAIVVFRNRAENPIRKRVRSFYLPSDRPVRKSD